MCYYLKIRQGIGRPQSVMPGVFSAINTRLQGNMVGKDLRELSPDLPAGMVESQEKLVRSAVISETNVYISGKYDLLVSLPDGSYMFIDLKLSSPTEEKVTKYQTQLWSYVYAFEHPDRGEPKHISRTGLLMFYPDTVEFIDSSALLKFPPTWLEVPIDRAAFIDFAKEVNALLAGPMPPENPECKWCQYRHIGDKPAHAHTDLSEDDMPF